MSGYLFDAELKKFEPNLEQDLEFLKRLLENSVRCYLALTAVAYGA
jgi:hypothetical protein